MDVMSRPAAIDPDSATGEAADLLARTQRSLGLTPNMAKVMANSPALLKGYLDLNAALARGGLDAGVRERIAITVAGNNGCTYCLSAHTYLAEQVAKVSPEEAERAQQARSSEPHTQAVLALAEAIVRTRGDVDDQTLAAARTAGLSDAEIAETVGHVAINVLTNYFNNLARTDIDWPDVTLGNRAA
jgi:uncharacterized peroxidase-related enzyme